MYSVSDISLIPTTRVYFIRRLINTHDQYLVISGSISLSVTRDSVLPQDLQSHEVLSYPKIFSHTRFCLTPRPSVTRDSVLPQDLQSHEILSYPKTSSHTRFCLTPRPFCLGEENGVSLCISDHLTLFSVFTSSVLLTRLKAAHRLCNEEINNNHNKKFPFLSLIVLRV